MKKKIGLALCGGAARGSAHLGVIQALEDFNLKPDYISGTSIGAVVAALYAFDVPIPEIRKFAESLKWFKFTRFSLSRTGFMSNADVGRIIESIIGSKKIEEAKIKLAIVASDIATGETVVLKKGKVSDAIMASTCIPGVFSPVILDGRMLVDGLITENIPVSPLKPMGADYIIAVSFNPKSKFRKPEGYIDVLLNAFEIAAWQRTEYFLQDADAVVELNLEEFSRTDFRKKVDALFNEGYRQTVLQINSIKSSLNE